MNVGAQHIFDAFLADEPPKCRRLWQDLVGLSHRHGFDLVDLFEVVRSPDVPVVLGHHVVAIVERLGALGSLRRLGDLVALADQVDAIDTDVLLIAGPMPEEDEDQ